MTTIKVCKLFEESHSAPIVHSSSLNTYLYFILDLSVYQIHVIEKTHAYIHTKRTFRNLQSHLAYRQIKINIPTRHAICESLVPMQCFRYERSLIVYENF